MPMLVAFEGIDGAGKTTQVHLFRERAERQGLKVEVFSFPRYADTLFGKCIGAYLDGQFGDLATTSPRAAALLYAGDRLESRERLLELLASNDVVVLDRYVASNLAHQGARVAAGECAGFLEWVARLEYETFELPRADLTVYLDMPARLASELVQRRKQRSYTQRAADIHESDLGYLAACREVYQVLARTDADSSWQTIECSSEDGEIREIQTVHEALWSVVEPKLSS